MPTFDLQPGDATRYTVSIRFFRHDGEEKHSLAQIGILTGRREEEELPIAYVLVSELDAFMQLAVTRAEGDGILNPTLPESAQARRLAWALKGDTHVGGAAYWTATVALFAAWIHCYVPEEYHEQAFMLIRFAYRNEAESFLETFNDAMRDILGQAAMRAITTPTQKEHHQP